MQIEDGLRQLAARQYGHAARWQAHLLGADDHALDRIVAQGRWRWTSRRVLSLVGAPMQPRGRAMAAVLDSGGPAVLSHLSGGWLWGLPGFAMAHMETTVLRGARGHSSELAEVHRPRLLLPSHLTVVRGIPVTTLGRSLFDIAPRIHPKRLEIVVDRVLGKSPGTLVSLHQLMEELATKGRPGIRVMREILAKRPPGYVAPATGLELRFDHILAEAGERPLTRQVDVGGRDWMGRVDFVDLDLRALFEVDSITFHTTPLDIAHDQARDSGMTAAGWIAVERVAEHDIWYRPWKVVAQVRAARARARQALAARSGTPIGTASDQSACQNDGVRRGGGVRQPAPLGG